MFGFGNKKDSSSPEEKPGLFSRLKDRLGKTRSGLTDALASLVLGSKTIDDELFEEIETQLLSADIGVEATRKIMDDLTARLSRNELNDGESLMQALRDDLTKILAPCSQPLVIPEQDQPFVIGKAPR